MSSTGTISPPPHKRGTSIDPVLFRRALCSFGIALGAVYAYSYRFGISPDGIGYLDVAYAYARHDWANAINGWWSPAYSWVLAAFISLFPPTSSTELPLLHTVNFLCFAWTGWSFHRFWQALLDSIDDSSDTLVGLPSLIPFTFDLFGYGLFFLLFLPLIITPTPDVFASSFIFLIAERLLRCETRGRITWRDGLTLGILFALAYFAKGILLYFGIIALGMAAFDKRLTHRRALLASSVVLVVIIAPWLVALHHTFGRWTLGFTGQLNYAWFIDGTQTITYPGPIGAPLPYFPGNKVFNQPAIYEVQTQPNVTYVPWYDPARFDKWDHAHFQWRGQIAAIQKNLIWSEAWLLVNLGAMSVGVLAVIFTSGRATTFRRYWIIAAPTLAVLTMYVLVYIRTSRYVVALAVLLFALALASVRTVRANQSLVRAVLAAGLIVFAMTNLSPTLDAITNLVNHNPDPTVEVAEALNHLGIHPNSHIGTVGAGLYAYWAHLARVNVAAEIWDEDAPLFWNADPSRRGAMLCAMARAGASAVIGRPPANADVNGWEPLGKSGYWLRRVSPEECEMR